VAAERFLIVAHVEKAGNLTGRDAGGAGHLGQPGDRIDHQGWVTAGQVDPNDVRLGHMELEAVLVPDERATQLMGPADEARVIPHPTDGRIGRKDLSEIGRRFAERPVGHSTLYRAAQEQRRQRGR
jgi:hypothetical protein